MKLIAHFKQFHSKIKLGKERLGRIESALSNLQGFTDRDGPISEAKIDLFQQGSLAIDTAVIPVKEGEEFDADAVVVLDVTKRPRDKQDPQSVIDWFADRLRENDSISDKIRRRPRCVRIEYVGDFHFDVVPSHGGKEGQLLVPIREDDIWQWKPSHPREYIAWVKSINSQSGGKFCRIMKMLKHWRNLKMGKETGPKSIVFTTLIGYRIGEGHALGCESDAEALVKAMEALNDHLRMYSSPPTVLNPSLRSEDLARNWDPDHFKVFKEKFASATQKAWQAFDEEDKEKSVRIWQDLFGERYFPTNLEGGAKMAEAVVAGNVYIKSSGEVIRGKPEDGSGIQIPGHRSFGV